MLFYIPYLMDIATIQSRCSIVAGGVPGKRLC